MRKFSNILFQSCFIEEFCLLLFFVFMRSSGKVDVVGFFWGFFLSMKSAAFEKSNITAVCRKMKKGFTH